MLQKVSIWLLAVAFLGAGLVNVAGLAGTRQDFVRWGYPRWWGILTGGLEVICAILIAVSISRLAGVVLGAVIIAAAVFTVLRHRDYSHLIPLGAFILLIAVALT